MALRRISTRARSSVRRISSSSDLPFQPLELTIGVCTPPEEDGPSHWILMLAERNAEYATWFHVTGGPRLNRPWEVMIEEGRLNSWVVDRRYYVAEIPERRKRRVVASARKIPGKFCQAWVVDVLGDLEEQGVVPSGTQKKIAEKMEGDPYADVVPQTERQSFSLGCFDG